MARIAHYPVNTIINRFLSAQKARLTPQTYAWYEMYCRKFASQHGSKMTDDLTPQVLYSWLDSNYSTCSPSTQFSACRGILRALSWAVAERMIAVSPLRGFARPIPNSREITITQQQYAECLRVAHRPEVKAAIQFLWHTGARPQELRIADVGWLQGQKIVFPKQLSKGRKKRRVIFLDDLSNRLVQRLADGRSRGPVFRNSKGDPWKTITLVNAMGVIRRRTKIKGLCAYTFRHSFITRHLERGVDVPTVAELAGNSPAMIFKHYNHVANNEDRLLGVLRR